MYIHHHGQWWHQVEMVNAVTIAAVCEAEASGNILVAVNMRQLSAFLSNLPIGQGVVLLNKGYIKVPPHIFRKGLYSDRQGCGKYPEVNSMGRLSRSVLLVPERL